MEWVTWLPLLKTVRRRHRRIRLNGSSPHGRRHDDRDSRWQTPTGPPLARTPRSPRPVASSLGRLPLAPVGSRAPPIAARPMTDARRHSRRRGPGMLNATGHDCHGPQRLRYGILALPEAPDFGTSAEVGDDVSRPTSSSGANLRGPIAQHRRLPRVSHALLSKAAESGRLSGGVDRSSRPHCLRSGDQRRPAHPKHGSSEPLTSRSTRRNPYGRSYR